MTSFENSEKPSSLQQIWCNNIMSESGYWSLHETDSYVRSGFEAFGKSFCITLLNATKDPLQSGQGCDKRWEGTSDAICQCSVCQWVLQCHTLGVSVSSTMSYFFGVNILRSETVNLYITLASRYDGDILDFDGFEAILIDDWVWSLLIIFWSERNQFGLGSS